MNVLIAGKEDSQQNVIIDILGQLGHTGFDVRDRDRVFTACQTNKLDIILVSTSFVLAHGSRSITEIRSINQSAYVLIILVCDKGSIDLLNSIDSSNLDDVIRLPIEPVTFRLKINAYFKSIRHHRKTADQNNRYLLLLREQTNELKVADHVHSAIIKSAQKKLAGFNSLNQPASLLSGDSIFTSMTPSGSTIMMLADFTGHGLSAAIVALPSSEIFYGMVNKGYCISEIASELNKKLHRLLPRDMYCAAIIVEIAVDCNHISIWNGGLPEAYLLSCDNKIISTIESFQPPLGIMDVDQFNAQTKIVDCQVGDKVILYTDGILAAVNPQGVKIEKDIIKQCINSSIDQSPFFNIRLYLAQFIQQTVQRDDISVVSYTLAVNSQPENERDTTSAIIPTTWSFNTILHHDILGTHNPVPAILNQILEYTNLSPYREKLFMLLSELYNNALDHGILKLDSKLKSSAEGFSTFYTRREQLLSSLKHGWIELNVSHLPEDNGGRLVVKVSDSGSGFDFKATKPKTDGTQSQYHGRGVLLINKICDSVVYSNKGSCVEVIFLWSNDDLQDECSSAA
ncbi:Serine phosphatase RsbU, regulator of sigma subunit [hydrothermal vent metagenome]|uniref:Serine phosphatase RsbU, regulator of sigma subunit n=1 Tax=hydrothermal vent metagenome TaxID=652676 RepID=A0A3B0Y459_9ZZZZ